MLGVRGAVDVLGILVSHIPDRTSSGLCLADLTLADPSNEIGGLLSGSGNAGIKVVGHILGESACGVVDDPLADRCPGDDRVQLPAEPEAIVASLSVEVVESTIEIPLSATLIERVHGSLDAMVKQRADRPAYRVSESRVVANGVSRPGDLLCRPLGMPAASHRFVPSVHSFDK